MLERIPATMVAGTLPGLKAGKDEVAAVAAESSSSTTVEVDEEGDGVDRETSRRASLA